MAEVSLSAQTTAAQLLAAEQALAARRLSVGVLADLLVRRSRPGERPEEVLLDLGLLDEGDLALELAFRSGHSFEGLRGFRPDPSLFLYLPFATALAERVCPLELRGDLLRVASAYLDPDLELLHSRFPNLEFELVVAPRSEILEAIRVVTTPF